MLKPQICMYMCTYSLNDRLHGDCNTVRGIFNRHLYDYRIKHYYLGGCHLIVLYYADHTLADSYYFN